MPLRWQEVAVPLAIVLVLVVLKYIPATAHLPLARLAGIVSFGYAIYLSLRLIQGEEAVSIDGWSELRPSPVELFGALGGAALSGILLFTVILGGFLPGATTTQLAASLALSAALAASSGAIMFNSLLVRVRWNPSLVERQDHRGARMSMQWSEVVKVEGRWGGITLWGADNRRLSFSPLQSGAAELARFADMKARRNAAPADRPA